MIAEWLRLLLDTPKAILVFNLSVVVLGKSLSGKLSWQKVVNVITLYALYGLLMFGVAMELMRA